jgi:hypothetical protein
MLSAIWQGLAPFFFYMVQGFLFFSFLFPSCTTYHTYFRAKKNEAHMSGPRSGLGPSCSLFPFVALKKGPSCVGPRAKHRDAHCSYIFIIGRIPLCPLSCLIIATHDCLPCCCRHWRKSTVALCCNADSRER